VAGARTGAVLVAAASNGKALWYLTRGTGLVAMILLSASVALGIIEVNRWVSPSWPRFVTAAVHKNVSLLATAFLAVHIATSVVDRFAPIHWLDAVIPFLSPYRPLWLGLGALATDLLIALIITSLLRKRLGYRAFRTVHWAAYGAWPIAVVHGLGTGSDSSRGWALAVYAACLAAVAGCVWWRLMTGWTSETARRRVVAGAGSVAVSALMVVLVAAGPLRSGWAARAGTPKALIASAHPAGNAVPLATSAAPPTGFTAPFVDELSGSMSESTPDAAGQSTVTIHASLTGEVSGVLSVSLTGAADLGGGITLTSSTAAIGPSTDPSLYQGQVTALEGDQLSLGLHDGAGRTLTVAVGLRIGRSGGITGSVQAGSS
jgi:methionine sulfoxide reductase heme-binding subunit